MNDDDIGGAGVSDEGDILQCKYCIVIKIVMLYGFSQIVVKSFPASM